MTGFTLNGLTDVLSSLTNWGAAVQQNAQGVLSDSLDELQGMAQADCPMLSGNLRDSLAKLIEPSGQVGYIYTDVIYGPFVEMGTYKMAAQPFLFPNWKQEIPLFKDRLKRAVMA